MKPSVKKLIIIFGIISVALGFLITIPFFVTVLIGYVSFGRWTPYVGMVVAGFSLILGIYALVRSVRGKLPAASLQALPILGIVWSVSGLLTSFILWLLG